MDKITNLKKRKMALLKMRLAHLQQKYEGYKPHAKQMLFHNLGAQCAERLFLAGNRCGKTYAGAYEMAMHLTGHYPNWWQGKRFLKPVSAWAASNTVESTRDILQTAYLGDASKGILGAIPQHLVNKVTFKRGASGCVDRVYVQHVSGGVSALGFKSYDQGREKFQGTSRHFIHLDEEPEMRLYEECLLRTLDVAGHVILTMTPLKGMTDVCQHFLNDLGQQKQVVQASWDDANHLLMDEKNRLRKSLRPHEVEAREKGIPSLGSGKVYPLMESDIVTKRFKVPDHFHKTFAVDFGWSNPTAVVWGVKDPDTGVIYIYDVYTACEKTPQQHAQVMQSKRVTTGVCDPAGLGANQADGQNLIEQYLRHGIHLTPADNQVEAGVMEVLEAMAEGRLKVMHHLEAWWQEFRLYRRNESGKILKKNDHLMDATRYLLTSGVFSHHHRFIQNRGKASWQTV
ncbi:MAG: terminase family protein [Pseudomonadota bacterium]|nr:terminase family protein [Pseudomonadota bacterium]